jgi:hypothetical protein
MGYVVEDYQGSASTSNTEIIKNGLDRWVKILNNTGSTLTNGYPYVLSTKVVATDTSNPVFTFVPVVAAQMADDTNQIIVIDNTPLGLGTIANGEYGFAKIGGEVLAFCNGNTGIVVGDTLKLVAAADNFVVNQTATLGVMAKLTCLSSAVALESYAVNTDALKKIVLLDKQTSIA